MAKLREFMALESHGAVKLGTYTSADCWHVQPGWEVIVRLSGEKIRVTRFIGNKADNKNDRETVQYKKANGYSKGYATMYDVEIVEVRHHGKLIIDNKNAVPAAPSEEPAKSKKAPRKDIGTGMWPARSAAAKRAEEKSEDKPDISFGSTALEAGQ